MAINTGRSDPSGDEIGESIISLTPDYTDRKNKDFSLEPSMEYGSFRPSKYTSSSDGSGIGEIVSLPMMHGSGGIEMTAIPGGHVYDLAAALSNKSSSIWNLFFKSRTLSDC